MSKTKRTIKRTSQFKKDYKTIKKRKGYDINLLADIITKLANDIPLPPQNLDHDLVGNWKGHRECHITSDWLLVYKKSKRDTLILTLTRTGTHSDLSL